MREEVGIPTADGGDYEGRCWALRQKMVGITTEDGGHYDRRWWALRPKKKWW